MTGDAGGTLNSAETWGHWDDRVEGPAVKLSKSQRHRPSDPTELFLELLDNPGMRT